MPLAGGLVSDGALDIGGYAGAAALTVAGTLTEAQGTMSMASQSTVTAATVTIDHGSSLLASGTIAGNLVNDGSVGPASRLAVTGSYTQGVDGTLAAGFGSERPASRPIATTRRPGVRQLIYGHWSSGWRGQRGLVLAVP